MSELYSLTVVSGNKKTGPIPVSMTSRNTCPDVCPLKSSGICYAQYGPIAIWWRKLDSDGMNFDQFLQKIRRLPKTQLWRHNQAGDLAGDGDELDIVALAKLVSANSGRNGYTYTHKPLTTDMERNAVKLANDNGFTINLSGNDIDHADTLADMQIGPVVCVLPHTVCGPTRITTPKGRTVVVCPATYNSDVTCNTCRVCANPNRKSIIGFPAHGTKKRKYENMLDRIELTSV